MLDLNSDLGESFGRWVLGDDEAMLGLVTSANVACGFHAGDATTLRRTCALAAEGDVVVGAQVAYRDLAGFGRRFIDVDPSELTDDVLYQIGALEGLCRVAGTRVRYVKPHGALYNATVHHEEQAKAVVEAVRGVRRDAAGAGLPGSRLLAAAEAAGLRAVPEFFVDRGYTPEGALVPRSQAGRVAPRPGGGRGAGGADGGGRRGHRGGRHRRGRPRRVGVRARGLARRRRDGRGRPRRRWPARGWSCMRSPEQTIVDAAEATVPRVLAMGDAAVSRGARRPATPCSPTRPRSRRRAGRAWSTSCRARGPWWSPSARAPTSAALRRAIQTLDVAPIDAADGETVEIPVVYDGPDLAEVAELTGLDADEVVAAHTGTPWRVAFGGFAPGFAYLTGGDPRLNVARRVGAAHERPGRGGRARGRVQRHLPAASPGGWQLIGRTDAPLWDADRTPPALLTPGGQVRFVARTRGDAGAGRGATGSRVRGCWRRRRPARGRRARAMAERAAAAAGVGRHPARAGGRRRRAARARAGPRPPRSRGGGRAPLGRRRPRGAVPRQPPRRQRRRGRRRHRGAPRRPRRARARPAHRGAGGRPGPGDRRRHPGGPPQRRHLRPGQTLAPRPTPDRPAHLPRRARRPGGRRRPRLAQHGHPLRPRPGPAPTRRRARRRPRARAPLAAGPRPRRAAHRRHRHAPRDPRPPRRLGRRPRRAHPHHVDGLQPQRPRRHAPRRRAPAPHRQARAAQRGHGPRRDPGAAGRRAGACSSPTTPSPAATRWWPSSSTPTSTGPPRSAPASPSASEPWRPRDPRKTPAPASAPASSPPPRAGATATRRPT